MSSGSTKAVVSALVANGGIAISKTVAAAVTGSGSLLAESLHSWADCTNQVFLLMGMRQATRAPDENHPMGYARVTYFWAMLVAVLLFGLGGMFALYEGIKHLQDPQPVRYIEVSIAVLLIAVVLEGYSLWNALKEVRREAPGKPLMTWFRETRQSELMVVTAEDIGALAGLAIALVALTLTAITGDPMYDALGSITVGFLLTVISIAVVREVQAMITGESASPEMRAKIRAFLNSQPEVEEVYNIISIQWGADLMLAVKAKMAPMPSAEAMVDAINAVEERLQSELKVRWVFFEPDIKK